MATIDLRTEIKEFLSSRRARITPERAGLPAYGGNRRVKGLRREEAVLLAGVSVDYYVRMERGSLTGTSDGVLDTITDAPAWICNGRYDVLAVNHLARALYSRCWPTRDTRRTPRGSCIWIPRRQRSSSTTTESPVRWPRNHAWKPVAIRTTRS
ncbi:hypothetical protein H4W33_001080 [Kibdelosporangium phytohabitans]|nr:hypothetical protein [Kibdelosporangium phytohabitans]